MTNGLSKVTAVIVNYKTQDLVATCLESLLRFYPALQVLLVDNGSCDNSTIYITQMAQVMGNISAVLNRGNLADSSEKLPAIGLRDTLYGSVLDFDPTDPQRTLDQETVRKMLNGGNIGHGPALHQALKLIKTPYLLALDSDCEVLRGGFVEEMLSRFDDESVYAVGRMVYLDRGGSPRTNGMPHIHESVIVLSVQKYKTLEPYVHFGVPSLFNMPDAITNGYQLIDFPIGSETSCVHHKFQGSRKRFHAMPHVRSRPIMPEVFLRGLDTELIGNYFKGA